MSVALVNLQYCKCTLLQIEGKGCQGNVWLSTRGPRRLLYVAIGTLATQPNIAIWHLFPSTVVTHETRKFSHFRQTMWDYTFWTVYLQVR